MPDARAVTRTSMVLMLLGCLCAATAVQAAIPPQPCQSTCFEKRYSLADDANMNGMPDPGDVVAYDVTYCIGANPGTCTVSDPLDALNAATDLALVEDPANPGTLIDCRENDAGMSSCVAAMGATTITGCEANQGNDIATVTATMNTDACFSFTIWAEVGAGVTGNTEICNQATGRTSDSDDPDTPDPADPTCFTVQPAPVPVFEKRVVDPPCPDPSFCQVPIAADPASTIVRYQMILGPNPDPNNAVRIDLSDDVPTGALSFSIVDTGFGGDCSAGPPTCNSLPPPAGANGTGLIQIDEIVLDPLGGNNDTARVLVDVEFACPPLTNQQVVTNQGSITTPDDPTICDPCLSDTPGTAQSPDPTPFQALCQQAGTLEVTKSVDPTTWQAGDPLTLDYQIVITNPATNNGPLTSITVDDALPVDGGGVPLFDQAASCPISFNYTPAQTMPTENDNCAAMMDPSVNITDLDDLQPGEMLTIDFSLTIPDDLPDLTVLCNGVSVTATLGLEILTEFASACTDIMQGPSAPNFSQSTKEADNATVQVGAPVQYVLTLVNSGGAPGTNVVLTDDIPTACLDDTELAADPAANVQVSPGPASAIDYTGGTLTVSFNSVPEDPQPGSTQTITVTGLSASTAGQCCNQGFITSDEVAPPGDPTDDPATGNDDDETCITVNVPGGGVNLLRNDSWPTLSRPEIFTSNECATPRSTSTTLDPEGADCMAGTTDDDFYGDNTLDEPEAGVVDDTTRPFIVYQVEDLDGVGGTLRIYKDAVPSGYTLVY